jgi:hypothetical protein
VLLHEFFRIPVRLLQQQLASATVT